MSEVVTVNLIFDEATTIHKIDRILWLKYASVYLRSEQRIRFLMHLEKAEDLILKEEENKYKQHENIFESVRLRHPSEDGTMQEYYLNYAVTKYVTELEDHNKEPSEMTTILHRSDKYGLQISVQVDKYRKTKGVDGS